MNGMTVSVSRFAEAPLTSPLVTHAGHARCCRPRIARRCSHRALKRLAACLPQVERHPLLPQWELIDFCARAGVVVQAHTPLGQGKSEVLQHPVVLNVARDSGLTAAQARQSTLIEGCWNDGGERGLRYP